MPRLSEFYGIKIYMYHQDHAPPHFHAIYAGADLAVAIADGATVDGYLPRRAAKLVQEWLDLHRPELDANWQRAQQGQRLAPIDPLK